MIERCCLQPELIGLIKKKINPEVTHKQLRFSQKPISIETSGPLHCDKWGTRRIRTFSGRQASLFQSVHGYRQRQCSSSTSAEVSLSVQHFHRNRAGAKARELSYSTYRTVRVFTNVTAVCPVKLWHEHTLLKKTKATAHALVYEH